MEQQEKKHEELQQKFTGISSNFKVMAIFCIIAVTLPAPSWLRPTINMPSSIVPCYVAMKGFIKHKEDHSIWYSTPFYSGPQGYKMHLRVYANGYKDGAGTHVSVYVQIIQGEYDDTLMWPYTGTVTFEIINWKDDRYHVKKAIDFNHEGSIAIGAGNKPREEGNKSWGYHLSIHHNKLYGSNSQYVNNDILYISGVSNN